MRRFSVASALAVMLGAAALHAQAAKAPDDPMAKLLFPPELVLQHAQELGLQPAQRAAIVNAIKEAQGDLLDLQLEMGERAQALVKLLDVPRVEEASVLAQADKVMGLERGCPVRSPREAVRYVPT